MKTSSVVEKTLNKSFQTSYTFLFGGGGGLNIRPKIISFTLNLSPQISTPSPKDREFPNWVVFNGKTQHLPYDS